MTARTTDRKAKIKDTIRSTGSDSTFNLANFTLPESLPCSELEFPIIIREKPRANWKEILDESDRQLQQIEDYKNIGKEPIPKSPFQHTECEYIKKEVFHVLLPAIEETLKKAEIWNAFVDPKCFFNGIDQIVQELWNMNPRRLDRREWNLHVFNMPWVRDHLKENPRPYYPKSWLWPEDYAATMIQKTVRQYFVQREDDVQEMREFWRKLKMERNRSDLDLNPFLSKKFAETRNYTNKMKN